MSITLPKPMSRAQFFEWAEAQDERYEFDGEQPVPMTGGLIGHSRLVVRLLATLLAQLDGSPFEALGPDAGVGTGAARVRYPDAVIAGSAGNGTDRLVANPIAVFEVVSPSSSRTDRITKLREYRQVDSIRTYIILEVDAPAATAFHKQADGSWSAIPLTRNDLVSMPACGVSFALASLYGRVPDQPSGA